MLYTWCILYTYTLQHTPIGKLLQQLLEKFYWWFLWHWSHFWIFCRILFQYSPHAVINWIQIWQIWVHSWGGTNFFLWQLTGSTSRISISSFIRYCRDIIQVRWKTFISLCIKFIQETVYQILWESLEDITKTFWSLFSGHTVEWHENFKTRKNHYRFRRSAQMIEDKTLVLILQSVHITSLCKWQLGQ